MNPKAKEDHNQGIGRLHSGRDFFSTRSKPMVEENNQTI